VSAVFDDALLAGMVNVDQTKAFGISAVPFKEAF